MTNFEFRNEVYLIGLLAALIPLIIHLSRSRRTKKIRFSTTRFFTNQFKRSALPNGPKISSGGSLSPRGDWRAPSDAHAAVWLDELERNVPDSE